MTEWTQNSAGEEEEDQGLTSLVSMRQRRRALLLVVIVLTLEATLFCSRMAFARSFPATFSNEVTTYSFTLQPSARAKVKNSSAFCTCFGLELPQATRATFKKYSLILKPCRRIWFSILSTAS